MLDERKPSDSFDRFTHRWVTPATLLTLLGAVVWGVQLNLVTLDTVKNLAILNETHKKTAIEIKELDRVLLQATVVLEAAVKTQAALEKRMSRNEVWIIQNRNGVSK